MASKRKLNGSVDVEVKRKTNWSQEDAERLAQLLVVHGREGILNKQTNGATNLKKKKEWGIIANLFNCDPNVCVCVLPDYIFNVSFLLQNGCIREQAALINKFKKIMQELKIHAGWERRNAMRTGGGKADPKPAQLKLEVTGALLQLQQVYGHAMSGMNGFDSDGISSESPQTEPPPHQIDASDEEEENILNDLIIQIENSERPHSEILPFQEIPQVLSLPVVTFADETKSHDDIDTPTDQKKLSHAARPIDREQFFSTRTQQHRSYKSKKK